MPNKLSKLLLFLSSYAPLLIIFSFQAAANKAWYAAAGLALVAVLTPIALMQSIGAAQRIAAHDVVAESVATRDAEVMSYLVTYLLPFLSIDFSKPENLAAAVVLFLVVGAIYMTSNMIYINPILALRHYHIFEVHTATGRIATLLTKTDYIPPGAKLKVVRMGPHLLLEKQEK